MLEDIHVDIVFVPPNCTDRLLPLDLNINKSAKGFLKIKFQQWYSDQIFDQQDGGYPLQPITFPMHVTKSLVERFYQCMQMNRDIIHNGFRATGITDVLGL